MLHVLIVDDDSDSAGLLAELAQSESYEASVAVSTSHARLQCELRPPDLVFLSQTMSEGALSDWEDLALPASCKVILMGIAPAAEQIDEAFRRGARDFLFKPIDAGRVRQLLRQRYARLADDNGRSDIRTDGRADSQPSSRASGAPGVQSSPGSRSVTAPALLGESAAMITLRHQLERVAPTEASVLLLGESGTGKELVAQTIHCHSARRRQPFLPVNCGAISPQLIESEIFGHEKGSFTGADRQHKGYFERASGGTLFLDEVVEMPIELQVKLLRVLETGTFMRIGSNQELHTDVRIVAATNRDPEQAIAEGRLRLDLYHRLNVFPLRVPPLRERGNDIELLAQHFLDELNAAQGTGKRIAPATQAGLKHYSWPGNVRELRNVVQRAYILADELVDILPPDHGLTRAGSTALTLAIPVGTSLADVDRQLIFATLDLCDGVKKRAADLLGISLKTLYNRLEEYSATSASPGKGLTLLDRGKTVPGALCMPGRDGGMLN